MKRFLTRKAVLSLVLVVVFVASVFSVSAFASDEAAGNDSEDIAVLAIQGEVDIADEGDEGIDLPNLAYASDGDGILVPIVDGDEFDVEGEPDFGDADVSLTNVNKQTTFTLSKGGSKTFSFNVSGGLFSPDHNTVSVVITKNSGSSYQYISENVTTGVELANTTYSGNANRTLSNLDPSCTYEITLINLGTSDLNLTVSITSYID